MMEKPDVDSIDGLSPAISIDQKTTSRNPRSTVGTVTEIYDYLRLLYARVGKPHCPVCGRPIAGQSIEAIVDQVLRCRRGRSSRSTRRSSATARASTGTCFEEPARRGLHARQGRRRAAPARGGDRARQEVQAHDRGGRRPARDEAGPPPPARATRSRPRSRSPTGLVAIDVVDGEELTFSERFACPEHGVGLPELEPRVFSFNSPHGACPRCTGLGAPAGDRPRPARARPVALDRRGRARPLVGRQLELLRVGDPGDRRPLRDRPRHAVAGADRRAAGPLPVRHERRAGLRPVPQPDGAEALVHARLRGHRPEPRAPLPRDRLGARSASGSRSTCPPAPARPAAARG